MRPKRCHVQLPLQRQTWCLSASSPVNIHSCQLLWGQPHQGVTPLRDKPLLGQSPVGIWVSWCKKAQLLQLPRGHLHICFQRKVSHDFVQPISQLCISLYPVWLFPPSSLRPTFPLGICISILQPAARPTVINSCFPWIASWVLA